MTSNTDSAIDPAALKRLRELRTDIEKRNEARGRSAGLHWAQHKAKADQLERVAKIPCEAMTDGQDGTARMLLASAVSGDDRLSFRRIGDVLESCFGCGPDDLPTFDAIVGFMDGARTVHNEMTH
jgi:hypothetical protein